MEYRLNVLWNDNSEELLYESSTKGKNNTINILKNLSDVKRITCYSILKDGNIGKIEVISR